MEIIERRTSITRIEETDVRHPEHGIITVRDFYASDSDHIIETTLVNEDGYILDDEELEQEITAFLDDN